MTAFSNLSGASLATSISIAFKKENIENHLNSRKPGSSRSGTLQVNDHGAYLKGEVWDTVSAHYSAIKESTDPVDCITRLSLIVNMLRGRQNWIAAANCLDVAGAQEIVSLGKCTRGHLLAAQAFLDFERDDLRNAERAGETAITFLTGTRDDVDLRVLVSALWKLSHIKKALRKPGEAEKLILRAKALSIERGDLHGYSNTMLAEAHQLIADGQLFAAIEALLRVIHPPQRFKSTLESLFIAAEAARAIAVLETRYFEKKRKHLGLVNPFAALDYSARVFQRTTSKVMRVPYLGTLAIASPEMLTRRYKEQFLGIPPSTSRRPRFVRKGKDRDIVYERYKGFCSLCGKWIPPDSDWQMEHIFLHKWGKPSKAYSKPNLINYRPACALCNNERGHKDFYPIGEQVFDILRGGILDGFSFSPVDAS